jgi:hypothetical protein
MFSFDGFWGNVRREFMPRLFAALHGTLGSYLRDALQAGSVVAVACLFVPRAKTCGFFSFLFFPFSLVVSTAFSFRYIPLLAGNTLLPPFSEALVCLCAFDIFFPLFFCGFHCFLCNIMLLFIFYR